MDTSDCEIGRTSHSFPNCDSICPKDCAQKTEYVTEDHFDVSPEAALNKACQILK